MKKRRGDEMGKCVLCEKEIGDLEESSLHQCNMLRYNESISPPDVVDKNAGSTGTKKPREE